MTPAPLKVPLIAGFTEDVREYNATLDAQIARAAESNTVRAAELAALSKTKAEITARIPELARQALTSDDYAAALNTARGRLTAIGIRVEVIQNQTAGTVNMTGATPLVRRVVSHYLEYLPAALHKYFRPVAADHASRAPLIQLSECTRALSVLRDSWCGPLPRAATPGNRRQFNDVMRRALAGQFHLLADCPENTPDAASVAEPAART